MSKDYGLGDYQQTLCRRRLLMRGQSASTLLWDYFSKAADLKRNGKGKGRKEKTDQ